MVHGAAVDFFEMLGIFLVGTLIGAISLQISCALYNMLIGSSGEPAKSGAAVGESEPEPTGEQVPAQTLGGHRAENESTAIATAPLKKSALAAGDDWPAPESVTTLPGVPKPSFERAMGILFVAGLGNALANFVLFRLMHLAGQVARPDIFRSLPMLLISIPLDFLILSGTIAVMLPTRLGKALLVALLCLFLGALIAAVLAIIFVVIAMMFHLNAVPFR